MLKFLWRRTFYGFLVLLGINLFTFALFFVVNTPDDMARMQLGGKRVTPEAIEKWKAQRGYDRPLFYNDKAKGLSQISETLFFETSLAMFSFDFGLSDTGRNITADIKTRALPSLAVALPTFVIGLGLAISFALFLVFFRATYIEFSGILMSVAIMSISSLFFIIAGQVLFSKLMQLVPVSGFDFGDLLRFLLLPIGLSLIYAFGAQARFYRTIFMEEIGKDYVRTARAKGLSEITVLYRHVLRNALIPILSQSVAHLPLLFLGSLVLESFFSIPGLGSYLIEALQAQDFAIVRTMVFIGSVLYIIGLILTDLSYAWADPRIRLSN